MAVIYQALIQVPSQFIGLFQFTGHSFLTYSYLSRLLLYTIILISILTTYATIKSSTRMNRGKHHQASSKPKYTTLMYTAYYKTHLHSMG